MKRRRREKAQEPTRDLTYGQNRNRYRDEGAQKRRNTSNNKELNAKTNTETNIQIN